MAGEDRLVYEMPRTKIITKSPTETEAIGSELAEKLSPGESVLLFGELGAGKTTFTRGICNALGVELVKSPSFVIVNVYNGKIPIYHIDLYRIKEIEPIIIGEIQEYLWDKDAISIVEWAERLPQELIPARTFAVEIEYISENEREIKIENVK